MQGRANNKKKYKSGEELAVAIKIVFEFLSHSINSSTEFNCVKGGR